MNEQDLAKGYAAGRIGIGLLLLLFPRRMARSMWGAAEGSSPAVTLFVRMLGVRDAILGAGALAAMQQQGEAGASARVRPWMSYGAVADGVDAIAMLLAYKHLPKRKRFGLLAVAAGGAATGGYLMTTMVEEPRP